MFADGGVRCGVVGRRPTDCPPAGRLACVSQIGEMIDGPLYLSWREGSGREGSEMSNMGSLLMGRGFARHHTLTVANLDGTSVANANG